MQIPNEPFFSTVKREWKKILQSQPIRLLLITIPLILFTILATFARSGMVRDLPIAVCDEENSSLSRQIVRWLDASPVLKVVYSTVHRAEADRGIIEGKWYGAVIIPDGLSCAAKQGKTGSAQLHLNAMAYVPAGYIRRETLTIFKTLNAGIQIKRFTRQGVPDFAAAIRVNPISVESSVLSSPNSNYAWFLSPGLIFAQYSALILLASALITGGIRDNLHHQPHCSPQQAMISGALFTLTAGFFISLFLFGVLFPLTGIAEFSEGLRSIPGMILLTASSAAVGSIIGLAVTNRPSSVSLGLFYSMPAFIYSGYSFPHQTMPVFIAALSEIMPFTHFIRIWNDIRTDLPFSYQADSLLVLTAMTLVPLAISMIWIKKLEKGVHA